MAEETETAKTLPTADVEGADTARAAPEPSYSADQMTALLDEVKSNIDAAVADLSAKFRDTFTTLEGRIDNLQLAFEGLDVEKISTQLKATADTLNTIQESGATDLNQRLTKLELRLRHFIG